MTGAEISEMSEITMTDNTGNQPERIGVLLMVDIIDYTPQLRKLDNTKVNAFNSHFEAFVKKEAKPFNGRFIKRQGDAALFFLDDVHQALSFALRLREASEKGEADHQTIDCDFRIVAHYGSFLLEEKKNGSLDLADTECIIVFRMEAAAKNHDEAKPHGILVTRNLMDLVNNRLKENNIRTILAFDKKLKGFEHKTEAHFLVFPTPGNNADEGLLNRKMRRLERETLEIPVFGKLYEPLNMEDNFIDLDIDTPEHSPEPFHDPHHNGRMGIRGSEEHDRESRGRSNPRLPLPVSAMYETFKRGVIFGLPGSGKTTILKYFAYREFRLDNPNDDWQSKRVVMFIQCRNILSWTEWRRLRAGTENRAAADRREPDLSPQALLDYLLHCFLWNRQPPNQNEEFETARQAVHRAWGMGQLTLLVDALDEAPGEAVKDNMITVLKELLAAPAKGKQTGNRFYLTARFSERTRVKPMLAPETGSPAHAATGTRVFEVRALDMEQLRQLAGWFYGGKHTALYKEFDDVVWREEIARKAGGTPLTGLLVITFFEVFKNFDTRYSMYRVMVVFILVRAWKEIKEGIFDRDMKGFFKQAKSGGLLSEKAYAHARSIFDALTRLAYEHIDLGIVMNEEDILSVFRDFAGDLPASGRAGDDVETEAEQWLARLTEDSLMVPAGSKEFVFIHQTVMEYLAARFMVEKVKDRRFLAGKLNMTSLGSHLEKRLPAFFESEALPIAAGADIAAGSEIMRLLKGKLERETEENENQRTVLLVAAVKGLAELESFVDRATRRHRLPSKRGKIETEMDANRDAVEWIYGFLRDLLLNTDSSVPELWRKRFRDANVPRLSRGVLLEGYMQDHTKFFFSGDSQLMAARMELLDALLREETKDKWLKENERVAMTGEKVAVVTGSLLTLDSQGYHPDDKNFSYYRDYTKNTLTGLLGSPNLRHSDSVQQAAFSPDGKFFGVLFQR